MHGCFLSSRGPGCWEGAGCDRGGSPASQGPRCLSPSPSQDSAPGFSLPGSRRQVSSQSRSMRRAEDRARNFSHLETGLGAGLGLWGGYSNNMKAQAGWLTDSSRSLLMVWRPDACLVGPGGASASLFLTGSSHGRWSEMPLGGPFVRALMSFMRAPPL